MLFLTTSDDTSGNPRRAIIAEIGGRRHALAYSYFDPPTSLLARSEIVHYVHVTPSEMRHQFESCLPWPGFTVPAWAKRLGLKPTYLT